MSALRSYGIWLASLLLLAVGSPALAEESGNGMVEVFSGFQTLLDRHLTEEDLPGGGLVSAFDYREALARDGTDELLARQRQALRNFEPNGIDSREAFNAFWLNAYNFSMIAHILQERPEGELIDSVWDYGGRLNPFRDSVFERELFTIGGERYSLDGIEKGILLGDKAWEKGWAEARVHFAVNCASVGCPPLRDTVYTAGNVDDFLTENTRRALSTERHLEVDGDTLYLTELFDWYEGDFVREEGSVREFIRAYADEKTVEAMARTSSITYIDYDWALNTPENFPEFSGD